MNQNTSTGYDIAVIGLACRLPGASNAASIGAICSGASSLSNSSQTRSCSRPATKSRGQSPRSRLCQGQAGARRILIASTPCFNLRSTTERRRSTDTAPLFFLEVGWEALEDAGYQPSFPGNIGVFATCGMNSYMMYHLIANRRIMDTVGEWLGASHRQRHELPGHRLSYELDLKGPSMNVQTAVRPRWWRSISASQSLLTGESDMALVGGSTIGFPQHRGYLYKQDESRRTAIAGRFDAKARGTLFGSGVGVVVCAGCRMRFDDDCNVGDCQRLGRQQ